MGRVDFYVLEEADAQARLKLACRLAEKACAHSQRVLILTGDDEQARALDELLWTFRDRSFVPHELVVAGTVNAAPVLIDTVASIPALEADVLINVSDRIPENPARYARIVEPVDGDPSRRHAGRERYRLYREQGLALDSHNVNLQHEL